MQAIDLASPYLSAVNSVVLPDLEAAPQSEAVTSSPTGVHAGCLSDGGELFLSYSPIIDSVIANLCRHHHLRASEAEDFSSFVRLALLQRDSEVLRQHTGGGSGGAFLRVVIGRLLYDFRCELWGRWRPSAGAKRRGPVAVLLERLLIRDGLSLEEAVQTARTNHGVRDDREELWQLCVTLTPRPVKSRPAPEAAARDVASGEPTPDLALIRQERSATRGRIVAALSRIRRSLPPQDQLILRMRIDDGLPVSRIAATLHLNQKKLYRTVDRLYTEIREKLGHEGISAENVDECFGNPE
jgi:RNA polymerase sigma factor (sigma-70 family)